MIVINDHQDSQPWYKQYYVWLIIFFPMLAVIGGIVTIILAVQSNDGLVVDDYYKKGLEINRTLERDRIAFDYQLNAEITINKQYEEVVIKLNSSMDFELPSDLEASFLHATRSGLDKEVKLLLTQENIYKGNLSDLEQGKWYVHIKKDDWRLIKTYNEF